VEEFKAYSSVTKLETKPQDIMSLVGRETFQTEESRLSLKERRRMLKGSSSSAGEARQGHM